MGEYDSNFPDQHNFGFECSESFATRIFEKAPIAVPWKIVGNDQEDPGNRS